MLGLTLRRLTGLEVGKLKEEQGQLTATIKQLEVRNGALQCCDESTYFLSAWFWVQ